MAPPLIPTRQPSKSVQSSNAPHATSSPYSPSRSAAAQLESLLPTWLGKVGVPGSRRGQPRDLLAQTLQKLQQPQAGSTALDLHSCPGTDATPITTLTTGASDHSPIVPQVDSTLRSDPVRRLGRPTRQDRKFPRRPGAGSVSVGLKAHLENFTPLQVDRYLSHDACKGRLCDISLQGAAFSLDRPIEVGTELILRIWNPAARRRVDTTARVVWTTVLSSTLWVVGCELLQRLGSDQVQDVGEPQPPEQMSGRGHGQFHESSTGQSNAPEPVPPRG